MNNNEQHFVKMPIISALTDEPIGFEILLRKFRGISLEVFNRNPELYSELSFPLLQEIFELDVSGKIRGQGSLLYINLTPQQILCQGTLDFLYRLHHTGQCFTDIVIEMTEQELDCDQKRLKERLLLFKRFGFQLAIDDFGVKASNFQRVFHIDPNFIKLDRGFVVGYTAEKSNKSTLDKLVGFCHNLNKKVIVEGIETKQHYKLAKECSADYMQGYYFGLPEDIL